MIVIEDPPARHLPGARDLFPSDFGIERERGHSFPDFLRKTVPIPIYIGVW
jgi:hypothetical protein